MITLLGVLGVLVVVATVLDIAGRRHRHLATTEGPAAAPAPPAQPEQLT